MDNLQDVMKIAQGLAVADEVLTNLPEHSESVDSAIAAARSAINSARAGIQSK